MKRLLPTLLFTLAASQAHAISQCVWNPNFPSGPFDLTRVMPTAYVPADAAVGTVIGQGNLGDFSAPPGRAQVNCRNEGDVVMNVDLANLAPIDPAILPPIGPDDPNGHVLQTNVRGIGAMVRIASPFSSNGVPRNEFKPVDGSRRPLIPFKAFKDDDTELGIVVSGVHNYVTLIKTGDIAPGVHQINVPLFQATLDFDNIGLMFRYALQGTVIQAQCSIIGDPVSANPIKLGEWGSADFTGEGFTTPSVPFHITLSSCQTDPGGMTRASIELHGVNGSQPIGPTTSGIFGLTTDSTAKGVGIQVLQDDGSPLALETEVPLVPLSNGTVLLNFAARLYQTGPSADVHAGVAKGALSFTIRYR